MCVFILRQFAIHNKNKKVKYNKRKTKKKNWTKNRKKIERVPLKRMKTSWKTKSMKIKSTSQKTGLTRESGNAED